MLTTLDHDFWMREALALAQQAAEAGEIPVGAVVVHHPRTVEGASAAVQAMPVLPRIIGRGYNRREADDDPTAHAEVVAMREAGRALGSWRLIDCTLYVTLEPCPMCAGAMVQARLPRLVYGCTDPKAGAVTTLYSLCTDPRLNHRLEVVGDVLAEPCAAALKSFFARRR
jgi:tRNA(adenine34) deaminase